jgi:hypothetical protein
MITDIRTQILDAVENAEPVRLHFTEGTPGDRSLYADVLVPANYVTDETGGHRIPDTEITRVNVMDRRGDWRSVELDAIARVECV